MKTFSSNQSNLSALKQARSKLLAWGTLMAVVYTAYLRFFPLVPFIYRHGPALDIEMILKNDEKWFALVYVFGIFLLFFAFWQMLKIVHAFSEQFPDKAGSLRWWVMGLGILCGIILLGLYPVTALDVALYVVRARLWALYGASPMLAVPASYPQDQYIALAGEFAKETSPYGPVWELVAQIPMGLGVLDIAAGIFSMKIISLISYVGTAVLIGWHASTNTQLHKVTSLAAMTFFALNPLVLLEAIGNGHNDILMLFFMTLGLILWQREKWAWATLALTLGTLVKMTGLILMPLFGVAVLVAVPGWNTRLKRGLGMIAIFLITVTVAYRITGPFPAVFTGVQHALLDRTGYTPVYAVRVILREFFPDRVVAPVSIGAVRVLFVLYYLYLLLRIWRGKMTLLEAGFMAYFSQLLLGSTFRIWYPMWLIPFAALGLSTKAFWRTFLFSITSELSILMYFILWRWELRSWGWAVNGPLKPYWDYWFVMTLLTVPWTFGIPLILPMLRKWKAPERFNNTLWV